MSSRKATVIFLIIGIFSIVSLAGYLVYSSRKSSEELFVKPAVDKKSAEAIAKNFLESLGFNVKNYPAKRLGFYSRNIDTLYLLKKFGYEKTGELIDKEKLPYTYWFISWGGFKNEGLSVSVDSETGNIVQYEFFHSPSADEKINNLKESQARELAEKFLVSQKIDPLNFELTNVTKIPKDCSKSTISNGQKKILP